jgi:aryl-alcohol dehydrogenase-like predicted oxidoreductase
VTLPHRPLGASGIEVSIMSLGSWRTYERMSRDEGLAVMRAAGEAGIDFLDDARYDDETGAAPIPTGWSEVVFGELFRATDGDAMTSRSPTSCGGSTGPTRTPPPSSTARSVAWASTTST